MAKIKLQNRPVGPFPTVLAGADVNRKPNYTTIGACGVVCQNRCRTSRSRAAIFRLRASKKMASSA